MPNVRLLLAILGALLLSSVTGALRAANAPTQSEFEVNVWDTDDGLPHNSVLSLAQAQDGHLWVGTFEGLVRFNGIHFTNLTPNLKDRVVHLFEDSRRTLWIGTENSGTLFWKEGQLHAPKELAFRGFEQRLRAAAEDAAGAVWLYYEHGGVWRHSRDGFKAFAVPPGEGGNRLMFRETNGPAWIATLHNQFALDPSATHSNGLPIVQTVRVEGRGIDLLVASRRAGYWRLANVQVQRVVDGAAINVTSYPWPLEASSGCEDHDGNLVIGTKGAGVFVVQTNGVVTVFSTADGLSANRIVSVLVDREDTVWVGTDGGGLNRIVRRQGFQTLESSRNWLVQSVVEDGQGNLWIGGGPGFGLALWNGTALRRFQPGPFPEPMRCVFVDREQRIWVSSARGAALYRIHNQQAQGVNDGGLVQHIVQAIHQDRAGRMWFGSAGGLLRLENDQWTQFAAADGLTSTNVTAIADGVNGDLWIGTSGGGINQIRDGKVTMALRRSGGVPSDDVAGLWMDEDGVLWATTSAGLGRWQEGKWTRYTTREGLPSDDLGFLVDDRRGNLWIASSAGLFHLPRKTLNAMASGTVQGIAARAYDRADGLPTRQCTFGSQPGAWLGRSNTLWFATTKGVASLNTARFRPNTNPPPVSIETVLVDDRARALSGTNLLTLRPADERVEIQYASLNLSAPLQARFRYRLDGLENEWIEAGATREARYTRLPPGNYTFHVTASNEDGVWNPVGTSLAIIVLPPPPPFWRTWWFLTFTPLVLIAAIIGIVHYLSTQKLQRQLAVMRQQEALEKERARIARDIHDQVGASLTQVALLGELVETDKDSPPDVEEHAKQICQTARETTRALDEIVWTVNPQNDTLEGLVNYICKNAQDYLAVAGVRYRVDVPAEVPPHPIPPDVRHNVFLASKEAVTNIVRHAKGTSAWIRMRIEPGLFTVEVEDNGRGVADLDVNAPRTRHGLKNMRKRMEDVGGTFSIGPGPEGGALVRLTVPLVENKAVPAKSV